MLAFTESFATHDDYLAWLDTRPDDEYYEVVDGIPVMSPGASRPHQRCAMRLSLLLNAALPPDHEVLAAPFDWVLWEHPRLQVREPDLLVCTMDGDLNARSIDTPPLLAVEVLSATSIERDLIAKRRDYALAGLDHYWVVDVEAPQIAIYRRQGDALVLVDRISGSDAVSLTEPFVVSIAPADLVA